MYTHKEEKESDIRPPEKIGGAVMMPVGRHEYEYKKRVEYLHTPGKRRFPQLRGILNKPGHLESINILETECPSRESCPGHSP
jgi:hypothetical protein